MSQKRKLTQDDLRKAMSEHKKRAGTVKKIESPLAKYNDAGQLMCIICKSTVKSEVAWPIHVNSKAHKDKVALYKTALTTLSEPNFVKPATVPVKRPLSPNNDKPGNKKIKGILKNSTQPSIPSALPSDFFDNQSSKENKITDHTSLQRLESNKDNISNSGSVNNEVEEEKEENVEKSKDASSAAVLPEGFFDDPILDAKVRNVEYKDPIEEEWDKFQKEIKEETAQSAQIIAEDQEEATTERQMDEIEEQIRHWSRVMDLVKRKEQVKAVDRKPDNNSDNSSADEEEFDEFLDWRAKNSYQ